MHIELSQQHLKPFLFRPYLWLLPLWVLIMIAVPILLWTGGEDALRTGVAAGVVAQFLTVMAILLQYWGIRRTLRAVAIVLPLTWLIEFVGSTTGVPFGVYTYTDALQPQLGHVPLLIPMAWLMMLPPAWAVASAVVGEKKRVPFVLVSALAFTAWDLFLDPQMVGWGYWVWSYPGPYFGIPLVNFGGWLLASALVTAAVRPRELPVVPLLAIYTVTWILQLIGQLFFWQMPGPALVGGTAMGLFVIAAWRRTKMPRPHQAVSSGVP